MPERRPYRYPVSEIFGPVCQGEGMLIGKPTVFVRLGGCDYRCSWCDSMYAVLPKHRHEWEKIDAETVADRALALFPPGSIYRHVTLSGGNPAIHPLDDLIDALHDHDIMVAIETQGTAIGDWLDQLDQITLSPKPPSSGNTTPLDPDGSLAEWVSRIVALLIPACLKVVCFADADYDYAVAVHETYPAFPFYLQAGTAVNVATRDDLCDALAVLQDRVCADPRMQDVAVLPQLHAILHGHRRGI